MALSATAVEFVPGKYWPGLVKEEEPYISELKDILYQLSINPGLFEEYMMSLTEVLTNTITEDWQLDEVTGVIFEQSVLEPNFTYTGARVIDHLFKTLPIPPGSRHIRSLVNHRAKDVVVKREEMATDPEQQRRLHGVTLFMAELFMNMEISVDGKPQKIKVYRTALQELFQSLTDHPSEPNLKCLGNIFKLAGKTIEDYDREVSNTQSSELINKIFNDGRNYIVNGKIDRSVRELWLQLLEFRASDWGRRLRKGQRSQTPVEGPGGATALNGDGDIFTNMPVFYSKDGSVITAKEAGYSEEDFAEDYQYDEYVDPNNLNFDPAIDMYGWQPDESDYQGLDLEEDEADAYEQFLRETGQDDLTGLAWGIE